MKQHRLCSIFLLAMCLVLGSCKKNSEPVAAQTAPSAQDVLKVGTSWIYENSLYDSTGLVVHSGPAYNDTTAIIRDTVINDQKWFVTSSYYAGGQIYVVQAIGMRNGEYWNMIRARSSMYDTVVTSPLFKLHVNKDESFENISCLYTNLKPLVYKRTVMSMSTSVNAGGALYDCIYLKETKIIPDDLSPFSHEDYYYSPVYGLIKHESYNKTRGGTVYRVAVKTLREIIIPS